MHKKIKFAPLKTKAKIETPPHLIKWATLYLEKPHLCPAWGVLRIHAFFNLYKRLIKALAMKNGPAIHTLQHRINLLSSQHEETIAALALLSPTLLSLAVLTDEDTTLVISAEALQTLSPPPYPHPLESTPCVFCDPSPDL